MRLSAAAPRRRDEARALFRDGIVDAAEAVFAEKGVQGARMQDIAARARIAVGTVYNHFDEKEDILHAVLEERTAGLLRELAARGDDPSDFAQRLTTRLGRMLGFIEAHRAFYVVALECGLVGAPSAGGRFALHGKRLRRTERIRETFRGIVDEGVAAGAIAADLARSDLARFLGATFRALTLDRIVEGRSVATDARAIVHLFLRGAGAPPPRMRPTARKARPCPFPG